MTESATLPPKLAKRRTYRRLMFGSLFAGVVLALAARGAGYPLVGEAVYWVGILGFAGVWLSTSVTLFDERDTALERRASQLALTIAAPLLIVAASALRTANEVFGYTAPAVVQGAVYGVIAVYVLFVLALGYVWLRT
jgi:hypothetical protein